MSAANSYDVNSLAVPRKAKEAIGAITKLARADGSSMTINVEYNQVGAKGQGVQRLIAAL